MNESQTPRPVVQSLWIGKTLSVMEQLAIRSFLENGHPFHLYAYEEIDNIPAGTVVRCGEEILPAAEIFCYPWGFGKGSVAAFADLFRYKLLLERGGWWADMDAVCARPLDFEDEHVLGLERSRGGGRQINNAVIKAPIGSPLMEYCWEQGRRMDRARLVWGQLGPRLLTRAVEALAVPARILPPEVFYPIDYWQVWQLIRSGEMPGDCYTIHLWNARWHAERLDPNAVYDQGCLFEQLKRRYGVPSPPGAPRGPGWRPLCRYGLRRIKAGLRRASTPPANWRAMASPGP